MDARRVTSLGPQRGRRQAVDTVARQTLFGVVAQFQVATVEPARRLHNKMVTISTASGSSSTLFSLTREQKYFQLPSSEWKMDVVEEEPRSRSFR